MNSKIPAAWDATPQDDVRTVAAIGILAFICTDIAHEVVGHGVGLLIAGGRSGILTTTRLIYERQLPSPNWRFFDIGGPAGNLTWAGLCLLTQRLVRGTDPKLRLFLWATTCFSLFWEFGYLIKCGASGRGDAMALVDGLKPPWLWQALLFVAGVALYRAAIPFITSELHFVVSSKAPEWRSRVVHLLVTLGVASGLIACAGPFFDPRGRIEMLNSGAASILASWVALFFVPSRFALFPDKSEVIDGRVQRSVLLILLSAAASVFYVFVLGRGIRFAW